MKTTISNDERRFFRREAINSVIHYCHKHSIRLTLSHVKKVVRAWERKQNTERGQGLLEFALILVLIAFIAIACYVIFAPQIQAVWERAAALGTL